jgi:hypothetical protein
MLSDLVKLAERSAMLRDIVKLKEAGLIGGSLKLVGGTAIKHPAVTASGAMAAAGGVSKARQTNAQFDPKVQQLMNQEGQ